MVLDEARRIEALRRQAHDQMRANHLEAAKVLFTQICDINPGDSDAWYMLSNINGMLGNIDEAGECCCRALALQPDHCDAYVNLGNVLHNQGKQAEAAEQYNKALQIDPNHAVAHSNFGNVLSAMGRFAEAATHYQSAIQLNPNLLSAYFNLGNLRMRQEQYKKAVNNYVRAILLNPSKSQLQTIREQGQLLVQNNCLAEAKALFTNLSQVFPEDIQAWHTLSIINGRLGAVDEAGDCCRRILAIQPDNCDAHINLGHVYFHHRKFGEAISHYEMALETNPQNILALNNLALACQAENKIQKYIAHYRKAIELLPDAGEARAVFIGVIKNWNLSEYDPWLDEELQKYFLTTGIDYTASTLFAARLLKHKYNIRAPIDEKGGTLRNLIDQIASDKLFLMYLKNAVNTDDDIESLLTKIRHEFLLDYFQKRSGSRAEAKLIAALAFQGHNNEYVFNEDKEEERMLAVLRQEIQQGFPANDSSIEDFERKLLIFGMYEGLYTLSCREYISQMPFTQWSESFQPLLEQTIINPLEEEGIKAKIQQISVIRDKTSQLVQSQYEENPYPRWVSVTEHKKRNINVVLKQWFPHFTPPAFLNGPIQILVAGCGTGQHPIQVALSYENAEILAIDISKSSLAYAIRMARKYKVRNIQFLQGDILQLSKLQKRFHVIECSGVLHHMEDPLRGWKALTDVLIKNGLMYIGLYSEIARRQIVEAREIIKNEKINSDRWSIRNFRTRIQRRELGNSIYGLLHHSSDFYSISGCRDLLFNFKEHRFTLPQISEALTSLQLKFIGFIHDNIETVNLYREKFPEDKEMRNLLLWDEFEKSHPNTFVKMYHLWCQKNNNE